MTEECQAIENRAAWRALDYERLINVVHDAAIGAGKRLCGPFAWRDRPDFTCFQNVSEMAAIARGVAAELGPLDVSGKAIITPQFAATGSFSDGLAAVNVQGKWGYIDRDGNKRIAPQFYSSDFECGGLPFRLWERNTSVSTTARRCSQSENRAAPHQ